MGSAFERARLCNDLSCMKQIKEMPRGSGDQPVLAGTSGESTGKQGRTVTMLYSGLMVEVTIWSYSLFDHMIYSGLTMVHQL